MSDTRKIPIYDSIQDMIRKTLTFPHCDSLVLHAPEECVYCDEHPDWQELRRVWGINFTGHHDEGKARCPAEERRTLDTINRWPGNRPRKEGDEG